MWICTNTCRVETVSSTFSTSFVLWSSTSHKTFQSRLIRLSGFSNSISSMPKHGNAISVMIFFFFCFHSTVTTNFPIFAHIYNESTKGLSYLVKWRFVTMKWLIKKMASKAIIAKISLSLLLRKEATWYVFIPNRSGHFNKIL